MAFHVLYNIIIALLYPVIYGNIATEHKKQDALKSGKGQKMDNNWSYDCVCTLVQDAKVRGKYYTKWRSTDGYLYSNDERLNSKCAYKLVSECDHCRNCSGRKYCLAEIAEYGKTIY